MTGSVFNRGNQVGLVPLGEIRSVTWGEIVDSPIYHPLQSKFSSPFLSHHSVDMGRPIGRGRKREGCRNAINIQNSSRI